MGPEARNIRPQRATVGDAALWVTSSRRAVSSVILPRGSSMAASEAMVPSLDGGQVRMAGQKRPEPSVACSALLCPVGLIPSRYLGWEEALSELRRNRFQEVAVCFRLLVAANNSQGFVVAEVLV